MARKHRSAGDYLHSSDSSPSRSASPASPGRSVSPLDRAAEDEAGDAGKSGSSQSLAKSCASFLCVGSCHLCLIPLLKNMLIEVYRVKEVHTHVTSYEISNELSDITCVLQMGENLILEGAL